MPKLTIEPEASVPRGPRRRRLPRGAALVAVQLALVALFGLTAVRQSAGVEPASAEPPRRVRYTVTREEWPQRPPKLREIRDRYAADLPAMRVANEPGACADPEAVIDYGDTVFIDFSETPGRCD